MSLPRVVDPLTGERPGGRVQGVGAGPGAVGCLGMSLGAQGAGVGAVEQGVVGRDLEAALDHAHRGVDAALGEQRAARLEQVAGLALAVVVVGRRRRGEQEGEQGADAARAASPDPPARQSPRRTRVSSLKCSSSRAGWSTL